MCPRKRARHQGDQTNDRQSQRDMNLDLSSALHIKSRTHIHPEDGNLKVYRNIVKPIISDVAFPKAKVMKAKQILRLQDVLITVFQNTQPHCRPVTRTVYIAYMFLAIGQEFYHLQRIFNVEPDEEMIM
jgi:hypothetical protein